MAGEFEAWVHGHSARFRIDQESVGLFVPVFLVCGYSPEEVQLASDWLWKNKKPAGLQDHLPAIHRRIKDQRAGLENQEAAPAFEAFAHQLCGSQGMVVVPHFRCVVNGDWLYPWYTMAVICSCARAARIREQWSKSKSQLAMPMGLEAYEQRNPNWVEQVAQHRAMRAAEAEVRNRCGRSQLGRAVESVVRGSR